MKIVADSKARINNNNITESESSMLNNINNMMTNQLNLVQTIADDNFMAEFNTYLASYELVKLPALVTARNDAREAGAIAKEARQAVQKERAAAKAEGRAVNKSVIKKAQAASKDAKKARQKANQVKKQAKVSAKKAAVAKRQAKAKAKKAAVAKKVAARAAKKARQAKARAAKKAKQAKKAAARAAKKAAAAAKKAAALAAKNIVVAVNKASTWQEINKKTSGSYTYDANSISLTASTGSGAGTVNGESTIDFAARTIKMTYDGSV